MTAYADLLTVLHDIDAYRGKFCKTCDFYKREYGGPTCGRGYKPMGENDGCDQWKERDDEAA